MVKQIMLLPLDERPCNYDFIAKMMGDTDFSIVRPPKEILSKKKEAGDLKKIREWIATVAPSCYGAVISVDTLVYSGILPSRLHNESAENLLKRLEWIREIKEHNKNLRIFGFSLIMRCPQYSSSDEEPDYYGDFGREIFKSGYIRHRIDLKIATKSEFNELNEIEKKLPKEFLNDYLNRRTKNLLINKRAIELTREGIFDFLIIPQDDSSPFGYTARDQQLVRSYISENEQQFRVFMYPDADAVENTLVARLLNEFYSRCPMIYIKYASVFGDKVIPGYEDRPIGETIKYQIMASGGLIASSITEADIVLMVNTPGGIHKEVTDIKARINPDYAVNRTQLELVCFADYAIKTLHKSVCFADVAYSNGGDPELFSLLRIKGILYKLSGYAGWNTSSNTLGTCIPMAIIHLYYGDRQSHLDTLASRYLEDVGYMAYVRKEVCDIGLTDENTEGLTYFKLDGQRGKVAELIAKKLSEFADKNLSTADYTAKVTDCYQPWNRMFETGVTCVLERKKDKRIFVC